MRWTALFDPARPLGVPVLLSIAVALLFLVPSSSVTGSAAGSAALPRDAVAAPASGASLLAQARATLGTSPSSSVGTPSICATVHQANYVELNPRQRALNERCAYDAARASVSVAGWVQDSGNPPPFYLYDFVMTYDSSDGYVLLFGDPILPSAAAPSETWRYLAGNWSEVSVGGPASCLSSVVADDPADGYVVYFAGTTLANGSACPSAGETWTYHGGAWREVFPTTAPSPRWGASFTNDSSDGYLLLFGGASTACGSGGVCNDTWSFLNATWTRVATTVAPGNRSSAGMTFDGATGSVLLFGGEAAGANVYSMLTDTWAYHAGTWTRLSPTHSPPQPQPDGLAYDPSDGYAVYTQICWNYSGIDPYGPSELVWEFNGTDWGPVGNLSCQYDPNQTMPSQRLGEGTTYDATDGYFLLFGGGGGYAYEYNSTADDSNDTWSLHAAAWTDRTDTGGVGFLPLYGSSVIDDPSENAVVVYGGYFPTSYEATQPNVTSDTWEFASGVWTQLSETTAPAPREDAGFVYDAADGYAVLFGGTNGSTNFGDTWEFLAGTWTPLTPGTAPPAQSDPNMVYDAADGYVLLFGGGYYPATWTFHAGVWSNITATAGTAPGMGYSANPLAYDATDGYVLDFGTYPAGSNGMTNATWTFSGGTWTNITSTASNAPSARQGAAMAGMGPTGGVILYGGYTWYSAADDGYPTDTWQFVNGAWSPLPVAAGPEPRTEAEFVYDAQAGVGLYFRGQPAYPLSSPTDVWLWESGAGPNPFVNSFRATVPVIDAASSTTFVASVSGGTAPLTYSYQGLPSGCLSANVSPLNCTPGSGSAGHYSVQLTVTDANGNESLGWATLTVEPSPGIGAFRAAPSSVSVGNRTVLRVNVTGGIAPYSYVYLGLPPGCATQTVPALPCSPATGGTYWVTVNVTDADAEWAVGTLSLPVGPVVVGSLNVSSFAASPAQLILGNTTYLNVSASTNHSPLSYGYSGLPAGCATANASSLTCVPTAVGTFTVRANVTDGAGDRVSVTTNLTVFPVGSPYLARILSYGVSPSQVVAGGSVLIYLVATGGNGTLSYVYTGLPAGCASADVVALSCRPTALGTFDIALTVTDASGRSETAHAPLTVSAAPGPATTTSAGTGGLESWTIGLLASAVLVAGVLFALGARARVRRDPDVPPPGEGRAP